VNSFTVPTEINLFRSSRTAYQKWADAVQDESYTFENLLPYFRKVNFTPPNKALRPKNSTITYNTTVFAQAGQGGPLHVAYPNWENPITTWIGKSLSYLGLPQIPGLADGNIMGWGYTGFSIHPVAQIRDSSETSYLREALQQTTNLNIYKNTLAKKIIFDTENKAIGVLVNSGGIEYQINATSEVILSAGAVRNIS
jgi:choline dehydrogenase-like flavoprotein